MNGNWCQFHYESNFVSLLFIFTYLIFASFSYLRSALWQRSMKHKLILFLSLELSKTGTGAANEPQMLDK
jgi:uncharacterized MAPEG superfamily protein